MRKSGLHKEIASIFDGVPIPNNPIAPNGEPAKPHRSSEAEMNIGTAPEQAPASPAQPTSPSLVKRLSADPSENTTTPAIQVGRPMPLPKSAVKSHASGPSLVAQLKKQLFGSAQSLDAHQKKMAVMVGILSIVFAGVLYVSLGGVGKAKAAAVGGEANNAAHSKTAGVRLQDWKTPGPLPANLRNATSPVTEAQVSTTSRASTVNPGELVVTGIVFSKNKPSAIINNQILSEGQQIDGVRIARITKGTVEFEVNGNRWSQNVRR